MTDQQQRTQWALDRLRAFIDQWTPLGAHSVPSMTEDYATLVRGIRAIAPKADCEQIGYGVFQRQIDVTYNHRDHPSGYVYTLTSAVFDKPDHAENAHQGASKRHPENQYVICEIREVP